MIVVPQGAVNPPPLETITSPDGILTATLDVENAGVLLEADFGTTPDQVVATNLITNPGFEHGLTGWSSSLERVQSGTAWTGRIASGSSNAYSDPVGVAGGFYSARVRLLPPVTPAGGTVRVALHDGTNYVASTTISVPAAATVVDVPATMAAAAPVRLYVYATGGAGCPLVDTVVVAEVEQAGNSAPDPFTGDTASDGTYSYRWTGAAGASTSEKYLPGRGQPQGAPDTFQTYLLNMDGTVTATADGFHIQASTAGDSIGPYWLLDTPFPAGTHVEVRFDWSSPVPVGAREFRVRPRKNGTADDMDGWTSLVMRGSTSGTGWHADFVVPEDVTMTGLYLYITASVAADEDVTISNLQVRQVPPDWVRFVRDGTPVMSGNLARAAGGLAVAYDFLAPLGVPVSWEAVPIWDVRDEGDPSEGVSLVLPAPTGSKAWVKSTEDPSLSMLVEMHTPDPEWTIQSQLDLQSVPGSPLQVGPIDERLDQGAFFTFHLDTPAQRRQFRELLNAAPLLFQPDPQIDVDDMFCLPGDASEAWLLGAYDPQRHVTVPLIPVAAPPTENAPLRIPGRSYDDVAAEVASYDELTASYPAYRDVWQP